MKIERRWAMPNKWTFQIEPIRKLIKEEMRRNEGLWIDPFAGKSDLADITNDLNPEMDTDYHLKAVDFLKKFDKGEVDGGILVDPPYSATQLKRKYDELDLDVEYTDTNCVFYRKIRDGVARVLKAGATAITCGWNSVGIGKSRGFRKKRILLVCHGSSRNDTIVTVEKKNPEASTIREILEKGLR